METNMLRQWLIGVAASVCNISVHVLVMAAVVRVALGINTRQTWHPWLQLIAVMSAAVSVLMAAHTAEVLVWAFIYAIVGAAPADSDLIYFAFVNYTTLGYG